MRKKTSRPSRAMTIDRLMPGYDRTTSRLRRICSDTLMRLRLGVPLIPQSVRNSPGYKKVTGPVAAFATFCRQLLALSLIPAVLVVGSIFFIRLFSDGALPLWMWPFGIALGLGIGALLVLAMLLSCVYLFILVLTRSA